VQNEVKDIHVQKLTTKTEWDDEKRQLKTTIQVQTNLPIEKLSELLSLTKLDSPIYITVGSDQAKLPLESSEQPLPDTFAVPAEV
jgi:hypothetical protein